VKRLSSRAGILISLALVAVIVAVTALVFIYPDVVGYFFMVTLVVTLVAFLIVLLLRHFLLIWFSYLDQRELANESQEDRLPFVSLIVPAYNEEEVIERSIASLLDLHYPYYEVVVVDDGSTDSTLERAKRFEGDHYGIRVTVLTKENSGKANALNYGIRRSRGPIVVCMDADSRLTPESLRYAVRQFRDPDVGAVAGNVKVINRHNIWTKLQSLEYVEGLNIVRKAQGFFRSVNVIPGPIGIFRRRALEGVGYYDDDTFAEDFDLTVKLLADNWKIMYEPKAVAYTEAPEELLDLIKQRYRWCRGILQTLTKQKALLYNAGSATTSLSLWYMVFEGLLWPMMNIFANLFFVWVAMIYGASKVLVFWWLLLTVLDLAIAVHAVVMEKESFKLVPYALFYRFFYILIIDVCKVFATLEELVGFEMTWGKLERKGRI
jgi:poly-beta-1,6-N-acetyl-D-glucosamine synthase